METSTRSPAGRRARQAEAWCTASFRTTSSMMINRPVSSATSRKDSGCSRPPPPSSIRTNASAPPAADPNERFRADALAGGEVDDRLILDSDPLILQSAAQHALGHQPAD